MPRIAQKQLLETLVRWNNERTRLTISKFATRNDSRPTVFEGWLAFVQPSLFFEASQAVGKMDDVSVTIDFSDVEDVRRIELGTGNGLIDGIPAGWEETTRGLLVGVVLTIFGLRDGSAIVITDSGTKDEEAFRVALLQAVASSAARPH